VPGNYNLRTALIFCYHLKKIAAESHRMLVETVSMFLVNHSTLNSLKNSKVAVLTWETKNVENQKSLKTANCKHYWMKMLKLNNNSRINWMWHEKPSPYVKSMGKIQKMGKWVPHELNEKQQENRKITCEMLLARYKRKSFFHRIVTRWMNIFWESVDIFWESVKDHG